MMERSRRASEQMVQSSSSVRFPHSRQKPMRSLTSRIASARAKASSFGTRRMWNARRCAVRVPTPGRRDSCAIRLSTSGLNMPAYCLQARQAQSLEVAHRTAELRLHEVLGGLERLIHAREDEIGERLGIFRVDGLRRDRDLDDLPGPARLHLDHPAPDGGFDDLVRKLVLGLRHLLLHLLHLLEHLVHVHLVHSSTSRASNVVFIREMMSSSLAGPSASASSVSSSPSPTANASASRWPVTS